MPDTQRKLADILSLLADNSIGAIGANDARDTVMSVLGGYGGLRLVDGSGTLSVVAATPVKVAAFEATSPNSGVTVSVGGAARLTVAVEADYEVQAHASLESDDEALLTFSIRKNSATAIIRAQSKAYGTELMSIALGDVVTLLAAETIELWVESDVTTTLHFKQASMRVKRAN